MSRGDFLKTCGFLGGSVVLTVVAPSLAKAMLIEGDPSKEVMRAKLSGEVGEVTDFDVDEFRLETGVELSDEYVAPFRLKIRGAEFDFVALPPTMDAEGEPVDGERLFLQNNENWVELVKSLDKVRNVVVWRFPKETSSSELETSIWDYQMIFWYPALAKNWLSSGFNGPVFAPPTEMAGMIPGYIREEDQGVMIVKGSFPETAKNALFF